tara:strand:- start:83 stop:1579 length:1497 start_codon:yes stop_codon:yes gene_type:complete
MAETDLNPNNIGGVASQSYLASTSLIKQGVNDIGYINILSLNDGSLKTETVVTSIDTLDNKISEPSDTLPNDQLIINALDQLQIDMGVEPGTYVINSTQYFEVPNTIKKEYIIVGTVIDYYKNKPISNANVILPLPGTKFNTKTDKNGKFRIKALYPVNKDTEKTSIKPPILITAKGYIPKKLTPYALDSTVREDLKTTQLKSTKGLTEKAKADIGRTKAKVIFLIQALGKKSTLKVLLKMFIAQCKERLIPLLITLLSSFLIGEIIDYLTGQMSAEDVEGPCPTEAEIKKIKDRRNKLVRQLNQIYKMLNTALVIAGVIGGIATILLVASQIIKALPIPTSVPPGVGIPTSLIFKFQESITKLEKLSKTLLALVLGISAALLVLLALLKSILQLLAILDTQIERCSDTEGLEAVGFTLEPEEEDDNGAGNNNLVNGFLLGTVPDNKGIVGSLQRRYATATDSLGVVVLKGEPSFSANDQILIDELAFYITSNDLKAN